ncbi:MAG TPA: chloride channel protein [Gemmatimonadaceae bacterium]|nr:chloride channel protein [Gemmatimonadaceae bacterium]
MVKTGEFRGPRDYEIVDRRTLMIAALSVALAIGAGLAAQLLTSLIGLITNVSFYGRISTAFVDPAGAHPHVLKLLLVPMIGALIIGLMARYGSAAIRGHGIPEVMENVLFGGSRIPARVLVLKPLSAAIAIGTGGPFGAEGPIIATGGALGSLAGQLMRITSDERKILLASGAAAGMAATFGSPVSAVLLSVELLLFEYRARSLIPVALAAATATGVRAVFHGTAPVFAMANVASPSGPALAAYALIGLIAGIIAAGVTRATYAIEDVFEKVGHKLHIHWMWWPIIGAFVVGVVGIFDPRVLGVGYDNISGVLSGSIAGRALLALLIFKFIAWSVYLGSGTSGGTMAPLFTIGGAIGAILGGMIASMLPSLGVDHRVAGLVGMAAMFAGASHALLTSVVMAFETTRQPLGLLPLLAGCTVGYFASIFLGRHSIMTEKLARRGAALRLEYAVDHLAHVLVRDAAARKVVTLTDTSTVAEVREWIASGAGHTTHQGFPVLNDQDILVGVVTRRDILDPTRTGKERIREIIRRPPVVVYEDNSLRDAADQMVTEEVGRLPVVSRDETLKVVGILSRSDLLSAHRPRLAAATRMKRVRRFRAWR